MKKKNVKIPIRYKRLDSGQGADLYFERSLDLIFSPGCFTVEIEHSGEDVGLPMDYCGEEHYFVGNLVVTDSGTAGHKQENRVTGQQLTITSRKGKETKVFTRTFANGVWSQWSSLARTGMYNNISTTDELLATVESLVAENTRAKQVEEVVKRSIVNINSRLGSYAGTIALEASDLIPMFWDGTKMVSGTKYNVWIVPLSEGAQYSWEIYKFIQTIRISSEYPVLDKELSMKYASSGFIATDEEKFLVITITISDYDGSDYSIETSSSGIYADINNIHETQTAEKQRVNKIASDIDITNDELNKQRSILGTPAQSLNLTEGDFAGVFYNGNGFIREANETYNSFVIPIAAGSSIFFKTLSGGHSTVFTFSSKPKVGELTPVRKIESNNFVAEENERYLLINITVSYFIGGEIDYNASSSGLYDSFAETNEQVGELSERVDALDNEQKHLTSILGSAEQSFELTSEHFDNIMWNGTAFRPSSAKYNGFLIRITPGQRVIYSAPDANNARTITNYPSIDSIDFVRTGADLKGDFIAKENEHYLFLNVTVEIFSSYTVTLGPVGVVGKTDYLTNITLPIKGKTIVCFGDSITEQNDAKGKGWPDYMAEISAANVIRAGIGGTQLATRKEPVETIPNTDYAYLYAYGAVDISNLVKAWANNDWDIVDNAVAWLAENRNDNNSAAIERLKANPIEDTDIVIVFGGTNDCANGTFGSPNDTDPIQNTCGGINQIIDSILAVKPDMPIYFFNPLPRMVEGTWSDEYRAGQTDSYGGLDFPNLTKRIKECVESKHFPCCDLYYSIGINRDNIYTFATDGVHIKGAFRRLANKIYSFIMANRIWN